MRRLILAAAFAAVATSASAMPCSERVGYVRAIIDKDKKVGFIGDDVYAKMSKDLDMASEVCRSGQDARAQLMISLTQKQHGYPVRP